MFLAWTKRTASSCLVLWVSVLTTGCSSVEHFGHIPAVPAHRVPPELLGMTRADMQELTLTRLRQDPPEARALFDVGRVSGDGIVPLDHPRAPLEIDHDVNFHVVRSSVLPFVR